MLALQRADTNKTPANTAITLKYSSSEQVISAPLFLNKTIKKNKVLNPKNTLAPAIDKNDATPNKHNEPNKYLSKENIFCPSFKNISQDINLNVCPVNAIKAGNESIEIDENICIGCGICAARCPIGAIHIKDGKAKLNTGNKSVIKKMTVNNDNINISSLNTGVYIVVVTHKDNSTQTVKIIK